MVVVIVGNAWKRTGYATQKLSCVSAAVFAEVSQLWHRVRKVRSGIGFPVPVIFS